MTSPARVSMPAVTGLPVALLNASATRTIVGRKSGSNAATARKWRSGNSPTEPGFSSASSVFAECNCHNRRSVNPNSSAIDRRHSDHDANPRGIHTCCSNPSCRTTRRLFAAVATRAFHNRASEIVMTSVRIRHLVMRQRPVLHCRGLPNPCERHRVRNTPKLVLRDDHVQLTRAVRSPVWAFQPLVILLPVKHQHLVGVLLDSAGLPQVPQGWAFPRVVLHVPTQLAEEDDGDVELPAEGFEHAADVAHTGRVISATVKAEALQVVNGDDGGAGSYLPPCCL